MKRFCLLLVIVLAVGGLLAAPAQLQRAQAAPSACAAILEDLHTFTINKTQGDGTYTVIMYIVNNDAQNNYVGYSQSPVTNISGVSPFPSPPKPGPTATPTPIRYVLSGTLSQLLNARLWNYPLTNGGISVPKYPFDPKSPDQLTISIQDSVVVITTQPPNPVQITFTPTCSNGLFYGMSTPYNSYYVISFKKVFIPTPKIG